MKKIKINKRLLAGIFGSIIIVGTMSGCSDSDKDENSDAIRVGEITTFEPGEHILYKQISSSDERLEYHEGYEIVGVSGRYAHSPKAAYVNTETVECGASKYSCGVDYISFGTPVDSEYDKEEEIIEEGSAKIFEPGEHILYKESSFSYERLEYHEGYKVVGVSSKKYGPTKVLYVNIEPVECTATKISKGEFDYVDFGTVVILENTEENENVKVLK